MQPSRFGSLRNKKTNEIESMKASAQAFVRGSSRFDMTKENNINPHWPEEHFNAGYNLLCNAESSEKHELSCHLLNRPKGSNVKDEQSSSKESAAVDYVSMNNRIHYSGPLLPRGGNLEEMLKEHERQIHNAFRKARSDKTKLKTNLDHNGQTESLL
ncbi:granule-bound starch synthase 2 [Hibiscus syriacus]|uniref:Granule-bound starch synthase 2 n=1 Tax=Hibiscus syriacus TaxID=106335 RepID=A0A6A2Z917_HIBSY|nr:granule-bound starch synthase 2 [Hibiscus syriacus]